MYAFKKAALESFQIVGAFLPNMALLTIKIQLFFWSSSNYASLNLFLIIVNLFKKYINYNYLMILYALIRIYIELEQFQESFWLKFYPLTILRTHFQSYHILFLLKKIQNRKVIYSTRNWQTKIFRNLILIKN